MKAAPLPDFGARIKERLNAKCWNQSDLARACKMGRDSISTYVHGAVQPTPKNLAKLANALGCSPSDLLPDYTLPVNDDAVMEMTQLPNGKMRLKIIQAVELDTALQIFNILKK